MLRQLGFGCVSLTTHESRKKALDTLSLVYDEGIRHFDVARLYGMGHAEGILGDFIKDRRSEVTVTTKFGLNPPAQVVKNQRLVQTIKKILKKFPLINKYVRRKVAQSVTVSQYTPAEAQRNLEISLRELKTDYIDYYLLHEATLTDANNDDLIDFLNRKVEAGMIREFGLGTSSVHLQNDCALFNAAYKIFQFENSLVDNKLSALRNRQGKLIITHSAINKVKELQSNLANAGKQATEFSEKFGIDLQNTSELVGCMLLFAMQDNPAGKVLFASTRREHILSNLAFIRKHGGMVAFHSELLKAITSISAPLHAD